MIKKSLLNIFHQINFISYAYDELNIIHRYLKLSKILKYWKINLVEHS